MALLLRLLLALSLLALLSGSMVKLNHWSDIGDVAITCGIVGLAIYVIGNFIVGEMKIKKKT